MIIAAGFAILAQAQEGGSLDRFRKMDRDGDGRLSREEWLGPPKRFSLWDTNQDNYLGFDEIEAGIARAGQNMGSAPAQPQTAQQGKVEAGLGNLIQNGPVRSPHRRAFSLGSASKDELRAAGMDVSGLIPVYPAAGECHTIDDVFGEQWSGPTDTLHSGADIPAPYGEPVRAMADGVVIHKSDGMEGGRKSRGTNIVLQHAPADTGLPVWLYTLYSHFSELPVWEPGQRVRMGETLGPNGRSGVPGISRNPHLHLTMAISESPRYGILNNNVVPEMGRFIDPVAVFRGRQPMETAQMQALTGDDRKVPIAVMFEDGSVSPAGARVVWPFHCKKR
jgi:murein DD-endopeptidase MepM/ murein hydrolase activator NlpD